MDGKGRSQRNTPQSPCFLALPWKEQRNSLPTTFTSHAFPFRTPTPTPPLQREPKVWLFTHVGFDDGRRMLFLRSPGCVQLLDMWQKAEETLTHGGSHSWPGCPTSEFSFHQHALSLFLFGGWGWSPEQRNMAHEYHGKMPLCSFQRKTQKERLWSVPPKTTPPIHPSKTPPTSNSEFSELWILSFFPCYQRILWAKTHFLLHLFVRATKDIFFTNMLELNLNSNQEVASYL